MRRGLAAARISQGLRRLGLGVPGHVLEGLLGVDGVLERLVLRNAVQPELVKQPLELAANVVGLFGQLTLGVFLAHGLLAALLAERLG